MPFVSNSLAANFRMLWRNAIDSSKWQARSTTTKTGPEMRRDPPTTTRTKSSATVVVAPGINPLIAPKSQLLLLLVVVVVVRTMLVVVPPAVVLLAAVIIKATEAVEAMHAMFHSRQMMTHHFPTIILLRHATICALR